MTPLVTFDVEACPTPSYVCDLERLERNLRILDGVQTRTGAKILLALKGFALWSSFDLCRRYLRGTTASSLHELLLGAEEFGGERHIFAPAYVPEEMPAILRFADHIVFNSHTEVDRWIGSVRDAPREVSAGLRINPGYSEVEVEIYNPCARFSRLGVPRSELREDRLDGLEGLHFHSLCGQNSDVLERTVESFERDFGHLLARMRWLNLGGGHHITRADYDVERLCRVIEGIRDRHGVEVYLEPGEAIGLDTGVLVARVLDIMRNEREIAILDTSATAHMPDVLEMPYRPEVFGAGMPG
ncbi:MAG TPA: carboxynorspermidine decarboxylase, partial [Planctomycetota bacterium]|nr:carboxynorspermidine decarboxylase [Planctomycetota bacterium]